MSNKIKMGNNKLDKWEEFELGDLLDYEQPNDYIVESTEYSEDYDTPVLTAGKSFIRGYTNEKERIFPEDKLPIIIFDDFTTDIRFINFPFKIKSSAIKILHSKKGTELKFVYEVMNKKIKKNPSHIRHWISIVSKEKIKIPTLKEQKAIVDVLEVWDNGIELLKKKIEIKQKQKKFLVDNLVTGKIRLPDSLINKKYDNV